VKPIEVAIIGTGWCGGIRAETLASHALVKGLHLAETNQPRLEEIQKKTKARTATADYKKLLEQTDIEAV
jgi:myo-inositol 2-dehydrogenase/D-chiro-inositol 1-dehydrogenase